MLARGLARFAREEHMPIDPAERPRMAASADACRAVVAARLHAPGSEAALLRALRVRAMAGGLLDDPDLIDRAALDAGLEPVALTGWIEDAATHEALERDAALARDPSRAAVAMAHKLARNGEDGWRYTCPSYEISRLDDPGHSLSVPGFQPYAASEVAISNLAPELSRRPAAESALEVLEWAGEPLAAIEVAAIRDIGLAEAREELARIGVESPVGLEGWWTPRERVRETPLGGGVERATA
jgi:hypothetical protein